LSCAVVSTLVSERVGWDVRGLQSRLMQFQAMSIMAEIEGETEGRRRRKEASRCVIYPHFPARTKPPAIQTFQNRHSRSSSSPLVTSRI
jgi:hypothetical protein